MAKADLHVHSKFSDHPSDWFLQRLGANECYTKPEFIYETAKERGMTFVTITDHNEIEGSLRLKQKYPKEVFTGVESTAYFPEDGCKIHILIYGLTEENFEEIEKLRKNIYELREFLKEKNLAHSCAHATFDINGKLKIEHVEKLMLLFNVFEGINGGRTVMHNKRFAKLLKNLNSSHIEDLYKKYRIEPFGEEPWIKGITGGSDDHGGLFIGRTYTLSNSNTVEEFIESLKKRRTYAEGRHNDYGSLAFTVYKVAYEFSKTKSTSFSNSLISQLTANLFDKKPLSFKNRFKVRKMKTINRKSGNGLNKSLIDLIDTLSEDFTLPVDKKLNVAYDKISSVSDEFCKLLLSSVENDIQKGNITDIIGKVSSSLPGIFLSMPFFSAIKHLYKGRDLIRELENRYSDGKANEQKKILWFTDTLNDLNGVAMTLKKIGWLSHQRSKDIKIAASLSDEEINSEIPPDIMNFPFIFEFALPYYETFKIKIPSILQSLKMIYEYDPDEIFISTPGSIGVFGLFMSKLFNTKCIGVYHTDFTMQIADIAEDESITNLLEDFTRWFFVQVDEIRVPTKEYMDILEKRGLDRNKMKLFKRGLDANLFVSKKDSKAKIKKNYKINGGINLLYAGRISKDKNLDFLIEIYKDLLKTRKDLNLLIAGDGPYLSELKDKTKKYNGIIYTGRLLQEELSDVYSGSDLFVFPSITDTFGMAVIEAQACGLPVLVSDIGGPKEIVIDKKTGYVLQNDSKKNWVDKINDIINLIEKNPGEYQKMKTESRKMAVENSDWNMVLNDLIEGK